MSARRTPRTGSTVIVDIVREAGGTESLHNVERKALRFIDLRNVRSAIGIAHLQGRVEWVTLPGNRRGLRIVDRDEREAA